MKKPVETISHKGAAKRVHIPSGEEAGYETGSDRVRDARGEHVAPLNPVVHRGQDPELFWLKKYEPQELRVPIRSLYRHEHVAPELLIRGLYRVTAPPTEQMDLGFSVPELFGNATAHEELDKVGDYYTHADGWTNRLIQGDSLLTMTSLLEREGMAGQVQCIYIDPPYGIKYGSNWQIRLNNRTVTDGQDESLTGEPEQIKAFRDTWELGIHSYLTYLRDRLLVARDLLNESGSCFVQISDENVHLLRCLMDEVFGADNFISLVTLKKLTGVDSVLLPRTADFIVWYGKNKPLTKYRCLFSRKTGEDDSAARYDQLELENGSRRPMTAAEKADPSLLPRGAKRYQLSSLVSSEFRPDTTVAFTFMGRQFHPGHSNHWKTSIRGLERLAGENRIQVTGGGSIRYVRYLDDFPASPIGNVWTDISGSIQSRSDPKVYVVQTSTAAVTRCILMSSDPGDLILDPTCGSGTTAYVAEQWGRRWITIDTSRIALNIAKTRVMTATFPFYTLYDSEEGEQAARLPKRGPGCHEALNGRDLNRPLRGHNVRYGFVYKKVPHITLGGIANGEPEEEETLYDQPVTDNRRLRVAGPFTVETLQSYEPVSPEDLARQREKVEEAAAFEDVIFEHLKSAGVKTGDKSEHAVFNRIDRLGSPELHAEGFYDTADGEKKAYLVVGPKFGTVSRQAVNEAIKACRRNRDADWLLILGFAFASDLSDVTSRNFGNFQVSIVRMHDDLLQGGLLKKDKKAASFVTIGEPDIRLHRDGDTATVEIAGLDIYDPIRDEVKSRDVHDISYWMLDDDYDGSNFVVRQVFFCGGDKDEFDQWRRGLGALAAASTRKKAEQTLKIELDEEAFASAYGHVSRPFPVVQGRKVAVRVVSQFGEETTKVLTV